MNLRMKEQDNERNNFKIVENKKTIETLLFQCVDKVQKSEIQTD